MGGKKHTNKLLENTKDMAYEEKKQLVDKLQLIEKYIDEAIAPIHRSFRICAKRQAELYFCKCVKPKRKLRRKLR